MLSQKLLLTEDYETTFDDVFEEDLVRVNISGFAKQRRNETRIPWEVVERQDTTCVILMLTIMKINMIVKISMMTIVSIVMI